jgi:hypothetical protein
MKGREARPGITFARAIGGGAAALVVAAVVLGASPRVAYAAQHTMQVANRSPVVWDVYLCAQLPQITPVPDRCPEIESDLKSRTCVIHRLLNPGEKAICSVYGDVKHDEYPRSVKVQFKAWHNQKKVWDLSFHGDDGKYVELGLAPDGKATLDCGHIHYWTYDTK